MEQEMSNESKIYRLDELKDQIEESIANIERLIFETKQLNDVLNQHAKRKFKDFIKSQENQITLYEGKKKELEIKLDNVKLIIDTARHDDEKAAYLDLILNTLIQF